MRKIFPISGTCSGNFPISRMCSRIFQFSRMCSGIFLISGTCSEIFLVFKNVLRNFSDFQNVFRNFSGFSERILENFHFTKWNNSKICTGNGNRNSCFWIHISGSFRFHYGNFDPKYLESLLGTQMKHTALKNLICTGAKVRGSETRWALTSAGRHFRKAARRKKQGACPVGRNSSILDIRMKGCMALVRGRMALTSVQV